MKIALIAFIIWSIILFLYAISATICMGEEQERLEKQKDWLESELERYQQKLAGAMRVINDPNCHVTGSCNDCTHYHHTQQSCQRTFTFQKPSDYCSDWEKQ